MDDVANLERFYCGKKVLITGGLGFIGSTLARRLLSLESRVVIIDSLAEGYGGNRFNIEGIENDVEVVIGDIRDGDLICGLVQGKDLIFNLAGSLSHIDSMSDPFVDLSINCTAQLSVLEALKRRNRSAKILFLGTRGQYGRARSLPVTEEHDMHPIDFNGIHNIAGEAYHFLYHVNYGIKAVSLRLTNTYGPRHQMRHHKQGIINWFIRQLIDGRTIQIYGDGTQVRDTNYVDDVVEAIIMAMASGSTVGEAYNIGGTAVSLVDLVRLMIEVHGKGEYEFVPYPEESRRIEVGDYVADYSKFSNTVGWKPAVSLSDGLKRTLEYYSKSGREYW